MHEPKAILESICEQNRKFYSDPRGIGALKDLQQTFPNPWLYVAELLQNAVDEGATRIEVASYDDGSLVFEHNGRTFSNADVEALCARGVSAKGANTVGFMGIGFKSVFRSYESAQVSSEPWRFALNVAIRKGQEYGDQQREWLGAVLPYWDPSAESPSAGMKCRFDLSRRLSDLSPVAEDLERVLGSNGTLLALLAWQGVKELNWNGEHWLLSRDETPLDETGDQRVVLDAVGGEGITPRRWILFSKSYQPSRQAIARFLEHRQLSPPPEERERVYQEASQRRKVAVFCEIDYSAHPIPPDRGIAFALLPTSVTFPLGLHVQADWLVVVTRREIIQIEGNEWHVEILEQLPRLLRYFLEWLVTHHNKTGTGLPRGYDALPGPLLANAESDRWFASNKFVDSLRQELENLAFFPKPPESDGAVNYLTPQGGRFLPDPFVKEFDDGQSHAEVLFGDRFVSSRLLGVRAKKCVERLNLAHELAPADLVTHWNSGVVKAWLALFPEDARDKTLMRVLKALVDLDDSEEWRNAELMCLPTACNGFTYRRGVSRYPADWNILAVEDDIRHSLEHFLAPPERIVSWDFDRALQQLRSHARSYLDPIPPPKLDEVVTKWWQHMPVCPSQEQVGLIVRFSTWILEKQPQRKGLIQKLLCMDNEGTLRLLPNAEGLLAEPYAGAHRRLFFPSTLAVSPIYESQSPTASRSDWRAFFEKLEPPPVGRFFLNLNSQMKSYFELIKFVSGNYAPPSKRATWMSAEWRGIKVQSDRYTVVDAGLPSTLSDLLGGKVTRHQFSAVCGWLGESPAFLAGYSSVLIAYIPYGGSSVTTGPLPQKARWVAALRDASWVYSVRGDGPFRPCDTLGSGDPARPDAPVAELPTEMVKTLQQCGVEFGSALPDAPAIDRLRILGPTAAAHQLLEFVQAAITEAGGDEKKKALLSRTLCEENLFPMPTGQRGIDGSSRVPHGRIIWSDRPRSALGYWLIPIESFSEASHERKVLDLVHSFLPVPKTTTFAQVLDFLDWAWSRKPDAELVRRLLPRAYAYVREDLGTDGTLTARWNEVLPKACVFVQSKRQWVPVAGENGPFLDDLGGSILDSVRSSSDLATPGHFGVSQSDQVSVANLLGVKLLSSRFRIVVETQGVQTVPQQWERGFGAIQNWLRGQLKDEDEGESGLTPKHVPTENLRLTNWKMLRTVLYDCDTPVQTNEVSAASLKNGTVAVSGNPDEFSEELCKVLVNEWGLRLRRDLPDLLPRVAIELTKIDDEVIVGQWLSGRTPGSLSPRPRSDDEQTERLPVTPPPAEGAKPSVQPTTPTEAASGPTEPKVKSSSTPEQTLDTVNAGGRYTANDREARIRNWIKKLKELITGALTVDILPTDESEEEKDTVGQFRTDEPYRQAALKYEERNGRYPKAKGATQSGHDIDSYTHPEGHSDRKLIRRIEVKGRSRLWDGDEIVEMSDGQFKDALIRKVPDGEQIDSDFDYWLYVVERQENGELRALPIRNIALRTAHFALSGGSWRHVVEKDESGPAGSDSQSAA